MTTWQDTPGVRHLALAGPAECKDLALCDVFIPCEGYVQNALNNTGTEMAVTCLQCMNSSFIDQVNAMNLDAIKFLGEDDLIDHMVDRGAMAPGYEFEEYYR